MSALLVTVTENKCLKLMASISLTVVSNRDAAQEAQV